MDVLGTVLVLKIKSKRKHMVSPSRNLQAILRERCLRKLNRKCRHASCDICYKNEKQAQEKLYQCEQRGLQFL